MQNRVTREKLANEAFRSHPALAEGGRSRDPHSVNETGKRKVDEPARDDRRRGRSRRWNCSCSGFSSGAVRKGQPAHAMVCLSGG